MQYRQLQHETLAYHSMTGGFKMATLVNLSPSGMARASMTTDCQVVSDERRSSSAAFCQLKDITVSSNGPAAAMDTGVLQLQA